jgi:glycine oxidase
LDLKRFHDIDFILVGQGIAGSILAHQIIERGKKVLVYDTPDKNQSSLVAAGLFNPITGRKLVKTWKADQLFPFLIRYYKDLENNLGSVFFHPMPIYRPFLSIEEKNEMIFRSGFDELASCVDKILPYPPGNFPQSSGLGGLLIKNSGYLDIPSLISSMREFIRSRGELREESFEYEKLEVLDESIRYKNFKAGKIIFCEGYHVNQNLLFKWLPFRPVKGEMLMIESEIQLEFIYNRKIFILPVQEGLFKVGSTYDWDYRDVHPSEKARKYLEEKLNQILSVKYNVIRQIAGIRPATKDRRPFIGMHPEYPSVGIFNGLGSKGVTLSPYFAHRFVEFLLEDMKLDKEVNIKRYY